MMIEIHHPQKLIVALVVWRTGNFVMSTLSGRGIAPLACDPVSKTVNSSQSKLTIGRVNYQAMLATASEQLLQISEVLSSGSACN